MNRTILSKLAGEHPGMLLLFQEGDCYTAYGTDAELLYRLLLNWTRPAWTEDGLAIFQLCNIDLEQVLRAVLKSGRRVAILEQVRG